MIRQRMMKMWRKEREVKKKVEEWDEIKKEKEKS